MSSTIFILKLQPEFNSWGLGGGGKKEKVGDGNILYHFLIPQKKSMRNAHFEENIE
jgi:hypothetical protein